MNRNDLKIVKSETERFLAKIKALEALEKATLKAQRGSSNKDEYDFLLQFGCPETSAVKRSSLDLTRALAKLRRGGF